MKFTFIFIVLSIISYTIISFIKQKQVDGYLNKTTTIYTRAYNTIYNQYHDLADVIYSNLLNTSDVKEILENQINMSEENKEELRQKLYQNTIKSFKALHVKNLRGLNFRSADNTMFLKVKKISQFGNPPSNKRRTSHYVHNQKKPIHSYEIGKHGAGFRFIYPIFNKDNKYLGSIGIVFSASSITEGIMKQYYVLSNFFINEKYLGTKLYDRKPHIYKPSHIDGFSYDLTAVKKLKQYSKKDLKKLKPSLEYKKIMSKNMHTNKNLTFYIDTTKSLVTTIPIIHKLTGNLEASLVIRSKGDEISNIYNIFSVLQGLVIFLIGLIIFIFYKQKVAFITNTIAMEESLKKDKKILEQSKLAQMGEMLGHIAHQWRQPLNAISSAASGMKLEKEFNTLTDENFNSSCDIITRNTIYLSETIDTFRDFIKEKKVLKEVVVQDIVTDVIKLINASLSNNHIELITNIEQTPIKTKLIPGELIQVIINILNNAKDALIEKNIDHSWIKLSVKQKNNSVIITTEDNADGIPEDILNKIFNPYFTTKHQSQGTGLGLHMSRKIIIESLDGKLYANNTENGAKFTIELPIIQ